MVNSKKNYNTGHVTSKDGTKVGYRIIGSGPGVILLHGGANSSQHFMSLGVELSDSYTVYIPDRRGRGLSGSYGDNYNMDREVEDVHALIEKTGASKIFGLSSGALIALQSSYKLNEIKKTALYEPPLDIDDTIVNILSFMPKFDAEIAGSKLADATVTMLKDFGIYFGLPSWVTGLPHFLLVTIFNIYYKLEPYTVNGDDVSFTVLVPSFHYDVQLVYNMKGTLENFKEVKGEILLIGGSQSPEFLKNSLNALEQVLPNVKRVELEGLSHSGSLDSGNPKRVADELKNSYKSADD